MCAARKLGVCTGRRLQVCTKEYPLLLCTARIPKVRACAAADRVRKRVCAHSCVASVRTHSYAARVFACARTHMLRVSARARALIRCERARVHGPFCHRRRGGMRWSATRARATSSSCVARRGACLAHAWGCAVYGRTPRLDCRKCSLSTCSIRRESCTQKRCPAFYMSRPPSLKWVPPILQVVEREIHVLLRTNDSASAGMRCSSPQLPEAPFTAKKAIS